MPSPSPFLFDLDGTIADTIADIAASTNHVRKEYGLPPLPVKAVEALVGHGAMTLLQRAMPELGFLESDPRWKQVRLAYSRHHTDQCTVSARLYPGVREHLHELARRGHPLAIVTNKPIAFVTPLLVHLGIAANFGAVIGGDTLPQKKPDPEPLREALRRLGVDTVGAWMVGDSEIDVRAGKNAGLRTIACLYGYRPPELLQNEGADVYWTRFGG